MTKILEQNLDGEEEDTLKGKYLEISMGREEYGLDIRYVTEIIGIQPIAPVPGVPPYIRGLINLRGKIIAVMDMRLRFGMQEQPYTERTSIVVVDLGASLLGLIVDRVDKVLRIPDEDLAELPKEQAGIYQRFIKSIGKVGNEVKLLLDCEKLLSGEML